MLLQLNREDRVIQWWKLQQANRRPGSTSLNCDNMHRVRHTKMKNSQQWENEETKHQRYTIQTR